MFFVEGVASPGPGQQIVSSGLLAATLVLSLRAARVRREVRRPIAAAAGLLVAVSVIGAIAGDSQGAAAKIANLLLVTLAPPAVVVGTLRALRRRNRVTVEAVLSVLCLYLLIGMFFAFVYAVMGRVGGQFFAQNVAATAPRCLYFSFVTLTTVGYGDLTASSNLGHTLSAAEALVGQIYLVTVVSLIVSNLGAARGPLRASSSASPER